MNTDAFFLHERQISERKYRHPDDIMRHPKSLNRVDGRVTVWAHCDELDTRDRKDRRTEEEDESVQVDAFLSHHLGDHDSKNKCQHQKR